jgi:hypothetical protein
MEEEINMTAILLIQNLIHCDGHLSLHLALPDNIIWHKDLLASKADGKIVLQNLATATGMILATAPAVSGSSPNNLKDDAPGMLVGRRCMCTSHSHNGCRRRSDSLALCASSSAPGTVLAPLVGGAARTTYLVRIGGGGGRGLQLYVVVFVLCRAKTMR